MNLQSSWLMKMGVGRGGGGRGVGRGGGGHGYPKGYSAALSTDPKPSTTLSQKSAFG